MRPSEGLQTRSMTRKRKRSPSPAPSEVLFQPTPISSLFTANMDNEQLWGQLELKMDGMCKLLSSVLDQEGDAEDEGMGLEGDEDEEDVDWDEDEYEEEDDDDDDDDDDNDETSQENEEDASSDDISHPDEDLPEGVSNLRGEVGDSEEDEPSPSKRKRKNNNELDDGFFELSTFNSEAEAAEARWSSSGRLNDADDDSDDDMSVDLFAPVADTGTFDEEDLEDAQGMPLISSLTVVLNVYLEPFYKDFFDAPAKPTLKSRGNEATKGGVRFHNEVRVKSIKARGKSRPVSSLYSNFPTDDDEDDEDDETDGFNVGENDDSGSGEDSEDEDEEEEEDEDDSDEDSAESMSADDPLDTMSRLRDDLFADDDESSAIETGELHHSFFTFPHRKLGS
jgi:U3 small nucleolar RNA-associated protein MPP10